MLKSNKFFLKTIQLIGAAFIAKGFGFVREMVLANYYGATYVSDVFVAVQNIPAVIFSVFGTAVTTGFIPLYTELYVKRGKENANQFANNVFNIFFVLSIVLTVLGIVFSRELVSLFSRGFSGETFELCNTFAQIIMPTCIAIILVYVYNAYLQIEGMFNQNSLMNVPYNVVQILFIVVGFYIQNVYVLAVGLLVASYSQFLYLKILMWRKTTFKHTRYINFLDPQIKQMLALVGPVFISTGVNQLNSVVDRSMASGLIEGSVSALNYSSEVANIVTQVLILSLTTILYPRMTELFLKNDNKSKNQFIENYLNAISVLVLPLVVLIFIFSEEIIQVLFGRGAFSEETVIFVSKALKIYALGIWGASFRDVLNRIFYSMKNTFIPMINGTIAVLFNISLNFLLVKRFEYLGLAFATSFSSTLCTFLMFFQLWKKTKGLNVKLIIIEFIKILFATCVMILMILVMSQTVSIDNDIIRCIVYGGIGGICYLIVLIVLQEKILKQKFRNLLNKYQR